MIFDAETLQEKLNKANHVLMLMRATKDRAAAILGRDSESTFSSIEDLKSYGWDESEYCKDTKGKIVKDDWMVEKETAFDDAGVVEALGTSLKSSSLGMESTSSIRHVALAHGDWGAGGGVLHRGIGAEYQNYFNPNAGFLGAYFNNCPRYKAKEMSHPPTLPILQHWSDAAFILWARLSQSSSVPVQAPKHIVRIGVTNNEANAVIDHIRETLETAKNLKWPGLDFDIDSQEGRLLLSTDNGKSTAWLLINHKEAFGVKCVDRVRFWYCGSELRFSVMFYVSDVPEDKLVK